MSSKISTHFLDAFILSLEVKHTGCDQTVTLDSEWVNANVSKCFMKCVVLPQNMA